MWLYLNMLAIFCFKSLLLELMGSLSLIVEGMEHKGCFSLCLLFWDWDSKEELRLRYWMDSVSLL